MIQTKKTWIDDKEDEEKNVRKKIDKPKEKA